MRLTALMVFLLSSVPPLVASAQEGFTYEQVLTEGIDKPMDLAFVGDAGVIVVAACGGIHHIAPDGTRTELADIKSKVRCDKTESGLLGVAVAEDFDTEGHVYVYYSAGDIIAQRISRFPLTRSGNTLTLDAGAEEVLHDELPFNLAKARNSGGIALGPDDTLFFGVGDNGQESNVQKTDTPHGKIWKSGRDGKNTEIVATGLARPFRIGVDSADGTVWAGDQRDTIKNRVFMAKGGENFGWPTTEADVTVTAPVLEYSGKGVVVGTPYRAGAGAAETFPENFQGAVPVADYFTNVVTFLMVDGASHVPFETSPGPTSVRAIANSPDGSIWFVEQAPGKNVVSRIVWSDEPPVVTIDSPAASYRYSGDETLALSGSAMDPEDGAVTAGFVWNITLFDGDGNEVDTASMTGQTAEYKTPNDVDIKGRLEITLTTKDSVGSAGTTTTTLSPEATKVTWGSDPEGIEITVGDEVFAEEAERTYAAGTTLSIEAPVENQFTLGGDLWVLTAWGDGNDETKRDWVVPDEDVDMTASYRKFGEPIPDASEVNVVVEAPPAFAEPDQPAPTDEGGCTSAPRSSGAPASVVFALLFGLVATRSARRRSRR
jgi:glucose/arabinose dehydrogenase